MYIEGPRKSPCCLVYNPDHNHIGSVAESWTSELFDSIRTAFNQGKRHPACATCWQQESVGSRSPRLGYTTNMQNRYKLPAVAEQPVSIQWNFSNTCNFACRTCNLDFSTGWLNETKQLAQQGDE